MNTTRKSILEDAVKCVCTDREAAYGSPEDNFKLIAELWSAYREARFMTADDSEFVVINNRRVLRYTADDVSVMMALLKIARIATGKAKPDNYIDLAGYAACAGEIACKGQEG